MIKILKPNNLIILAFIKSIIISLINHSYVAIVYYIGIFLLFKNQKKIFI